MGDSQVFPAISVWSSGAHVVCDAVEEMVSVAPDKPWLVLCDVTFGRRDEAYADPYGNTPFHGCAYKGNVKCLQVLLQHVSKHQPDWPNLSEAVRNPSQPPQAKDAITPLQLAKGMESRCVLMLERFLKNHILTDSPGMSEGSFCVICIRLFQFSGFTSHCLCSLKAALSKTT